MIIKSKNKCFHHPITESILGNNVLVVAIWSHEKGVSVDGYTITLREMLQEIKKTENNAPDSVHRTILDYCEKVKNAQTFEYFEVYLSQEETELAMDRCCNHTARPKEASLEEFYLGTVCNYFIMLSHKLPDKVSYLV